jgi:hypothetical protein
MTLQRLPCLCGPILTLIVLSINSIGQIPAASTGAAKVNGRVLIEGKPASDVLVMMKKRADTEIGPGSSESPTMSAVTNAEGRYQFQNLKSGDYRISVFAPAYVIEGESAFSSDYGKTITILEGEQVEDLNFSLTPGGVVTGKVVDDYGMPVIAEGVGAFRLDDNGKRDKAAGTMLKWQTDDRGSYRIFGLESGRYIVGVGVSEEDGTQGAGTRGSYKRAYHPDTIEESQATIIEVKPGQEVSGIDIKLSRSVKTFAASGRVIDAESGKGLAGLTLGYDFAKSAGSSFKMGNIATNPKGEFRIEGLKPGTYTTYVYNPGQGDLYSDRVNFDIGNDDITGLEIKMIRGASISGVAEVDGTTDPTVLARLAQITLHAEPLVQDTATLMLTIMQGGAIGSINSDGTLRIGGVRPGRTRVVAMPPPQIKGFTLARVERNGAEIKDIDVAQGEQINGVRMVFTYGTSTLAGHVEVRGGVLPANSSIVVQLIRQGTTPDDGLSLKQANVDARGQFIIEGISEGNYTASLVIFSSEIGAPRAIPRGEQNVSIPADVRREITLVLDLSRENNR